MLVKLIKMMVYCENKKIYIVSHFLQKFIRLIFSCEIPSTVKIGEGTVFIHNGLGMVLHSKVVVGENCRIYQNVTIGGRHNRGCPIIEDDVFIGAGACILGGVRIGKGSMIGANAVVIEDVPPYTVVGGIPAKILKKLAQ